MIIKKFQGKTETEAILKAKEELGSTAIVMNIKTIKQAGIFRLFKPTLVEVTAALDEETESGAYENKKPENSDSDKSDSNAIEEKLNNLQNLLENQFPKEKEVLEEKEHMEAEKVKNDNKPMLYALRLIYRTLIDNEVDETYCNQLVDELEKSIKKNMDLDYLLSILYQKMVLKLGQANPIDQNTKGLKVIFFIGPTGVGKTTTIAKIASKLYLEEKKKVVLLTADTYRIAAAEQLKTYANILDIPFKVIYTPKEMQGAQEEFKEYDIMLVDTAGHSYKNEEQKREIKELLNSVEEKENKEVYLVVSAATKYKDLLETAKAYEEMADYKLIFTKIDETSRLGNIFNLRMHTKAMLSYITYGQSVPDDIELLDAQKIVKRLLGGK